MVHAHLRGFPGIAGQDSNLRPSGYETFGTSSSAAGFGPVEPDRSMLDHHRSTRVGKPWANDRTTPTARDDRPARVALLRDTVTARVTGSPRRRLRPLQGTDADLHAGSKRWQLAAIVSPTPERRHQVARTGGATLRPGPPAAQHVSSYSRIVSIGVSPSTSITSSSGEVTTSQTASEVPPT
jgi:hypothetical protein